MDILKDLSAEQLAELKAKIAEQDEREAQKRRDDVDAYKSLVNECVTDAFKKLEAQSIALAGCKSEVYKLFDEVLKVKSGLFKVKEGGQWSHTFTDKDSKHRITLGVNTIDNYDDTVNDGIDMVNEYLDNLAKDNPKAEQAVSICRSLMARDKKGNLKPSRIVTLHNHATRSGNRRFLEGVEIIMDAYHPVASKTYIRAEKKNEQGMWTNVPLGMTEAE